LKTIGQFVNDFDHGKPVSAGFSRLRIDRLILDLFPKIFAATEKGFRPWDPRKSLGPI